MEERRPVPGEFYRHFKNKYYQIAGIARHSETEEEMVVYQALYDEFGLYVRPLEMFVSEVDHEKYPMVTQKYRFERVDASQLGQVADTGYERMTAAENVQQAGGPCAETAEQQTEQTETDQANPLLLEFLDLDTYEEKLTFLNVSKKKLDNDIIDAMAASIDAVVPEGDFDTRFSSLKNCLTAHARYECTRLR